MPAPLDPHTTRQKFADQLSKLEKSLSNALSIPIVKELVPGGIDYGTTLLVEFEPRSLWHEASLTIATQALRQGIRTEYHVFKRFPKEVRDTFARHGLNVKLLEEEGKLRFSDTYTRQTGLGSAEASMKVSDWSIGWMKAMKAGIPEADKRWLHIDDDTSVVLQYNKEEEAIDFWRTRLIPGFRVYETVVLWGFLTGTASDSFYRKLESLCDGIVYFKSEEKGNQIEQYVRMTAMRSKQYDSRWHKLRLSESGEVALTE